MDAQMTHDLAFVIREFVDEVRDLADVLVIQKIPYGEQVFRLYQLLEFLLRINMFGFLGHTRTYVKSPEKW